MAQSNDTDKYNKENVTKHPERVVDGKYYEDDDALAKAKAEYEKKQQEAFADAKKKAEQRANSTARFEKTINETLYGYNSAQDSGDFTTIINNTVGGLELSSALGDASAVRQRQHLLDPTKYKDEYKTPNPGKMPMNEDPFPVDLKIEEFETHKPTVKVHRITTHVHAKAAAKAALFVSDTAEKRLVHLENNMATMMRYLFRLGARMHINCLYWGGTTPFEKYRCIRCMRDDRAQDGQLMQIDQCLTCTRFEPVYGQVYEVLNDLGSNVAQILDDNQMSYGNMEDYMDFTRTERYTTAAEKASFDLTKVLQRDPLEKDFKELWGNGIKMDWNPVPLEDQKTHINWRQSINDDGSSLKRLASFPQDEDEAGDALTHAGSGFNVYKQNWQAMEQKKSDSALSNWISAGASKGQEADSLATEIKNTMEKVKAALGSSGQDALAIYAIDYARGNGGTYAEWVKEFDSAKSDIACKNPALIIPAMFIGHEAVKNLIRHKDGTSSENDKKKSGGSDNTAKDSKDNTDTFKWPKFDPEKCMWTEIAEAMAHCAQLEGRSTDNMAIFPQVCYLYVACSKYIRNSKYDTENYGFPWTDEEIQQYGSIYYTAPFHEVREGGRLHKGTDMAPGQDNVPFRAIADGEVTAAGDGWGSDCNAICIQETQGGYTRYLHCSQILVHTGDSVSRGQQIGVTGGTGANGPSTYPVHLHIEHGTGDARQSESDTDCTTLWQNSPQYAKPYNKWD